MEVEVAARIIGDPRVDEADLAAQLIDIEADGA
jgi:hypothetical protein